MAEIEYAIIGCGNDGSKAIGLMAAKRVRMPQQLVLLAEKIMVLGVPEKK